MLHLALVQKKGFLGKPALRLLASQKPDNNWVVLTEEKMIECPQASSFSEGLLVLVDIAANRQLMLQEATNWVLEIIQQYLSGDMTSPVWQAEKEQAEEWRQSLTLQSQDLSRRAIEIEALREKNQQLADELKAEKSEVDLMTRSLTIKRQQLEKREIEIQEREKQLQSIAAQVQEFRRQAIEAENLKRRNQDLETEIEKYKQKIQELETKRQIVNQITDPNNPFSI